MILLSLAALFAPDCYLPCDADRFRWPDPQTAGAALTFNYRYRTYLEAKLAFDLVNAEQWRAAIRETQACWRTWDAIEDARCRDCPMRRRLALARLRQRIGRVDYALGRWPPIIPTRWLEPID